MRFIAGLIIGLLIIPVGTYLYFRLGYAPVATSESPMPFEAQIAQTALQVRIEKESPKNTAIPVSPDNMVAGAKIYHDNCAFCHGLKGQEKTAAAEGMFPKPPQLFTGHGVTDDPPGETYWKAANGIRLSGMPAYKHALSDQQIWQVSVMLANADKLPEEAVKIVSTK
jgi:mono/diheme cytochrome c family protein